MSNTIAISVFLLISSAHANPDPQYLVQKAILIHTIGDTHQHAKKPVENLEYFDETIVNATQLRIRTDTMPVLGEGAFRNMPNLEKLQMPNCHIAQIYPRAFLNVPNLDRIQLQDNALTRIEHGIFNYLNVSQLFLHRNRIQYIHSEAFDNMPNLFRIKLNANELQFYDNGWFFNTPKLTDIFVRRNAIARLERNAFKNVKKLQVGYEANQNSTNIYLSKNRISYVHPQALSELVRLNDFYLDRNNLSEIPAHLFDEIQSIGYLNLERNRLAEIPEGMFKTVSRFGALVLNKNELECIPAELVRRVDKVSLEENSISCECLDGLKKAVEGRRNKIEVGDCERSGNEENEEDEAYEEDEEVEE